MRTKLLPVITIVILALGGCSLINSGPTRDSKGHVTERATISAQDLKDKDCFTFNSTDGHVVEKVTVMPCSEKHQYFVLAQGSLTATDITSAGSLQNAVSAKCAGTFEEFKKSVKSTTKPKQEFLVFPETDKKNSDQLFSCVVTDPDQDYTPPSPTPTTTPSP